MGILNLSKEQLQRFHMNTLEEYKKDFEDSPAIEREYYETFLIRTDYITLKMAESLILGEPYDNGYVDILELRKEARTRINELDAQK